MLLNFLDKLVVGEILLADHRRHTGNREVWANLPVRLHMPRILHHLEGRGAGSTVQLDLLALVCRLEALAALRSGSCQILKIDEAGFSAELIMASADEDEVTVARQSLAVAHVSVLVVSHKLFFGDAVSLEPGLGRRRVE